MDKDIKIIKVINKDKKYVDAKGKEHTSINYYVKFNNTYTAIRPSFAKGYYALDMIAETIVNGKNE